MSETSAPDNPKLRWQEDGELYKAEERVLKAFRVGWKADDELVQVVDGRMTVVVPPKGSNAPEKPAEGHTKADWQDAILRAEFLRDLFLGNYDEFDPRLIEISRAWIEGRLDLSDCESRLPLAFSQCIFSDGISLRNATIPELQLPGCEVRRYAQGGKRSLYAQGAKVSSNVFLVDGFKANGEVNLVGASLGGGLICNGDFGKGLNAYSLETKTEVFLREGFKSNGEVRLDSANIGGQLDCDGGHFEGGLFAPNLKTGEDVLLRKDFKSNGEVRLDSANIGGQLDCDGGHFEGGLFAQNLKTDSDVFLREGFKSNGEVRLSGANIGGQLDCSDGHFEEGLRAPSLKTDSHVFLSKDFKSNGGVRLNSANIGGRLDCSDGHFEGGLDAQDLKTGEYVFLRGSFKSNGGVSLNSANIGGQLDCSDGHFEGGLYAQSLKTGEGVFLRGGFKSNGWVDLHSANIGGELACFGGHLEWILNAPNLKTGGTVFLSEGFKSNGKVNLKGAEINGSLDLGGATIDFLLLDAAKVHGGLKNLQNWPHEGSVDGFHYQTIEDISDWQTGLEWVEDMTSSGFAPQPYEQLMAVYRRMGHTNWARNIGFALEKRRSKEFKGWQLFTWRPWYGILRWTIGYGYRPFGFFLWAVGLMAAGFLLFSSGHDGIVSKSIPPSLQVANEWVPSEGEALASDDWKVKRKPPRDYLPFNPLVYSLEATFPVLNLGQLEKWHPSNGFLLGVRWAWTLIGTLLLAILALFGAGVLGPRWRSGDEGD